MHPAAADTDPLWGRGPWAATLDEPTPRAATAAASARRWPTAADLALLLARVVLGVLAVLHGAGTLVGIPRGTPRAATEAALAGRGFMRPDLLTTVVGWVGLVAGVLLVLGLFASFAASALLAGAVAAAGASLSGAWVEQATGTAQVPLLALALTAVVVLTGPGRVAADAGRSWARRQTLTGLVCLALGVAVGVLVLVVLR